jgi:hypothetical protein
VAVSNECGDEPSGSGATDFLVARKLFLALQTKRDDSDRMF